MTNPPAISNHRRPAPSRAGFALVIALLLTALLLALIMALVSLTYAEVRIVQNTSVQQRARQNAMSGVYQALGQLQWHAGPDQRVTGSAGLLDSNPNTDGIEGVANPWLTGVWEDDGSDHKGQQRPARLRAWLISGGRGTQGPLNAGMDVGPDSRLENPRPGGSSVWLLHKAVGADERLSVKAPKLEIKQKPRRRSAARDAEPEVVGHYAWWVADEGVKARLNMALPEGEDSAADRLQQARWSAMAAPRPAPWEVHDLAEFPRDSSKTERVLTFAQAPLLAAGGGRLGLARALERHFHSFTADSFGVLSDTRSGGLKDDLSLGLEMSDDEFDADPTFDGQNDKPMFAVTADSGEVFEAPSWRALRDWYRCCKRMLNADSDPLLPASLLPLPREHEDPPDPTDLRPARGAVTPLMTRLIFAYSLLAKSEAPQNPGDPDQKLVVVLDPIISLWNPYNVRLQVDAYRVDALAPTLHLVIEKRDPWKPGRHYRAGDEVWHGSVIYRAARPNVGVEPPGQNGEWAQQDRSWSLAADVTQQQLYQRGGGERGTFILLADPDNPSTKMTLEPGEFAVHSPDNDRPQPYSDNAQFLALKRGWNPGGGVAFDRLLDTASEPDGTGDQDPYVRVYGDSEVRVTIEPYRDGDYAEDDPFEFIENYPDQGFDRPDDFSTLPMMEVERLGFFQGGATPLEAFDWRVTRSGPSMEFRYSTRAYHGEDDGKPLPGRCDALTVSDHLSGDRKRYLGMWQWLWKTEADLEDFPAQTIARFNPRFGSLLRHPDGGYPCTVPHYQILARKLTSDFGILEMDGSGRSFWGPSITSLGEAQVPVFEAPSVPVISMGALQHFEMDRSPWSPGYGVGGGLASPYIPRSASFGGTNRTTFDTAWHSNRALLDRWCFSSICPYPGSEGVTSRIADFTSEDDPRPLPNRRMYLYVRPGETRREIAARLEHSLDNIPPHRMAAANLLVKGAFNINSTSVEAWQATLAGLDGLSLALRDAEGGALRLQGPLSNLQTHLTLASGPRDHRWRGYRELPSDQVKELAREIVKEVKRRGPFTSVADFVNRRLADDESGLTGALQAALDQTALNRSFQGAEITEPLLLAAAARGGEDDEGIPWAFPYPAHATGPVAAGATGFLQQGDLLQALLPQVAARSDTFKIRAYGDVVDPLSGRLRARAWVEAVVQRLPDYVSHSMRETGETPPETSSEKAPVITDTPWTPPSELKSVANRQLGRRFRIVRLRWLSPDEV